LNSYDLHVLGIPPKKLQSLPFEDVFGTCMPQSVRVIFYFGLS
jgi:hypothetical protein